MTLRTHAIPRRAFTLIEAVIVVVAIAVVVPPTLLWMDDAAGQRADAANATRASALASAVMENILADVSSRAPGLGFDALNSSSTYLNTAKTGLTARMNAVSSTYKSMGITYSVTIGKLVDYRGAVNASPALNAFRNITVTVQFKTSRGASAAMTQSTLVTRL